MKRAIIALMLALMFSVEAQSNWPRQVLLEGSGLTIEARTPNNNIMFTFGNNYPPAAFPATYLATTPAKGLMPFQVRSTATGIWNLLIEIADLRDGSGRLLVPANQIEYRVNGGRWQGGNGAPQIIYTQSGATQGWKELRLEFRLKLLGNEIAGVYAVQAYFSALTQP